MSGNQILRAEQALTGQPVLIQDDLTECRIGQLQIRRGVARKSGPRERRRHCLDLSLWRGGCRRLQRLIDLRLQARGRVAVEVEDTPVHPHGIVAGTVIALEVAERVAGVLARPDETFDELVAHAGVGGGVVIVAVFADPVPGDACRRDGTDGDLLLQQIIAEVVTRLGVGVVAGDLEGDHRCLCEFRVIASQPVDARRAHNRGGAGGRSVRPPDDQPRLEVVPVGLDADVIAAEPLHPRRRPADVVVDAVARVPVGIEPVAADLLTEGPPRRRSVARLHRQQGFLAPGGVGGLVGDHRLQYAVEIGYGAVIGNAADNHLVVAIDTAAAEVVVAFSVVAVAVAIPVAGQVGVEVVRGRLFVLGVKGRVAARPEHLHRHAVGAVGGRMGVADQKNIH